MRRYSFLRWLYFIALTLPIISHGQSVYEGQVLDNNKAPVPFATVSLVQAHTATRTNDDGYFSLSVTGLKQDTLVFSCVGYQTYKLPISAYKKNFKLILQGSSTDLKEVSILHTRHTQILEAFSDKNIYPDEFVRWKDPTFHIYTEDTPFLRMSMFAKLFEAPVPGASISEVQLGRGIDRNLWFYTEPDKNTRFKLHVITVNTANGAPDSILYSQEVSLHDLQRRVVIKFEPGKVTIPSINFYIAIEWLRIPYNEFIEDKSELISIKDRGDAILQLGYYRLLYQPLLIGYNKTKKLINALSWMKIKDQWQPFVHPDYEVALAVTLSY